MRIVAFAELIILTRVVFGAILFRNSLLAPLIYAHFLRQRYYQSAFTRDAVATADARISAYANRQGNPPVVPQVWGKIRELTGRWAGSVIEQQPAQGARRD